MAILQKNIVVFASGSGSNAQKIFDFFKEHALANVVLLVCNRPDAPVLDRAQKAGIPTLLINKASFVETDRALNLIKQYRPDIIVLAGFLWKIPKRFLEAFPNKIINIHPSLLPKYGGKGMYGHHVHEAVAANRETETGITIHYVNEHYDEGQIIFQTTCPVLPTDTPELIAQNVLKLEHHYYPLIIEQLLK